MPEKGWKSVSLPTPLLKIVEQIVEENPAYTSIAEFIRAALTRFIKETKEAA